MSVQNTARFLAILALDEKQLSQFLPELDDEGNDIQEDNRTALVDAFTATGALTADERDLFLDADVTAIFEYIRTNMRPIPDPPIGG